MVENKLQRPTCQLQTAGDILSGRKCTWPQRRQWRCPGTAECHTQHVHSHFHDYKIVVGENPSFSKNLKKVHYFLIQELFFRNSWFLFSHLRHESHWEVHNYDLRLFSKKQEVKYSNKNLA